MEGNGLLSAREWTTDYGRCLNMYGCTYHLNLGVFHFISCCCCNHKVGWKTYRQTINRHDATIQIDIVESCNATSLKLLFRFTNKYSFRNKWTGSTGSYRSNRLNQVTRRLEWNSCCTCKTLPKSQLLTPTASLCLREPSRSHPDFSISHPCREVRFPFLNLRVSENAGRLNYIK